MVTRRVGGLNGEGVRAVGQRGGWGKAPAAAAVERGGAEQRRAVIHGNGAAHRGVPCNSGRVSSVGVPLVTGPVTSPVLSVTVPIVGVPAGVVSMFRVKPPVGSLALPAGSIATAVSAWLPSGIAVGGWKLQLPFASTVAVPICAPSMRMLMVLPGSPVPLMTGRLSFVGWLLVSGPV